MPVRFPAELRASRADAIATRAGNGALLRLYSGAQPADCETAVGSQVLLAELTCGTPFAPSSVAGVLTVGAITQDASANADGVASFFRIVQSNGTTVVMDGSVSAVGGGGDLQLASTRILTGQPVQVSPFVWTEGNAP